MIPILHLLLLVAVWKHLTMHFLGHSTLYFSLNKHSTVSRIFLSLISHVSPVVILCGREFSIKCIIDLHAAPGSQNGMEHSASRDGTTGWPTSSDYISQTLNVIDFLASRYILMLLNDHSH